MADQYNALTRPSNNLTATVDPTASSDSSQGYAIGSHWLNATSGVIWYCINSTIGAAIWLNLENPASGYSTAALQSAQMTAAQVSGSGFQVFENTGTTPANLQFPTAAQLLTALPFAQVGTSWMLLIRNSSGSANTATITTATGITLTGTMTIAQNASRLFNVKFTAIGASPAVTVQSLGTYTGA